MTKKIVNTFCFFLLLSNTNIFSQSLPDSTNPFRFSELSAVSFKEVWLGAAAWGDYNNDDNVDLLITGLTKDNEIISKLYQNNGNALFIEQTSVSLTGVYLSAAAWGDYDNDGDLDLLLIGNTSIYSAVPIAKVYKNNGGNSFIEQTSISLTGVYQGAAAWGDYNNDGFLDILLTGQSVDGPVSKVYQNNGSNSFIEQTQISIAGVKNSTAHFIDYNNDGQLDIFITGSNGQNRVSKLYRNNGNNSFTEQASISFQGVESGSSAWGDYDGDGDLDLLLTGLSNLGAISKVYRNNGNNSFSEQTSISLQGIFYGCASWCDLDNDGMLDIFLTGATNSNPISTIKVYRNNHDGSFSSTDIGNLETSYFSAHAWGDIDNDSDLDLFLSGSRGDTIITKIYKNENLFYNSVPDPPTNLSASFSGNDITFKWNRSFDTETPQNGLSYNLIIGTTPNSGNKLTAMSNRENGFRKVLSLGNVNQDTIWTIKNLSKGIYYWSVQSVDNTYRGSEFAPEQSIRNYFLFSEQTSISIVGVQNGSSSWGDFDNDGDLDLLMTGATGTGNIAKVYRNDGNGIFAEESLVVLPGVSSSSAAWGDYNNDGFLDIILTGSTGANRIAKIYKNNGDRSFSETAVSLPAISGGSVQWGDYDNDGDLDLLVTGTTGNFNISKIFRNDGNDQFVDLQSIQLHGVVSGSGEWGDYDNDGDLDILLTGRDWGAQGISKIYRNDSNSFTEISNLTLPGVFLSSAKWGDYDNDGDLDILLTGINNYIFSKIFRNDGNSAFAEQTSISLAGAYYGSANWADFNNDGYLDIFISGTTGAKIISKIYLNDKNNSFSEDPFVTLPGVYMSSIVSGDFDNDGDLDIQISGYTGSRNITKIFTNNCHIFNNQPAAPMNLSANIIGDDATLTWNRASDLETPQNGLTYNLVIGKLTNSVNIKSPMADRTNGFRRVVGLGNANQTNEWTIKDLPKGTYYWAVQTIDNSFSGSMFSEEKRFDVGGTKFVIEGLYDEVTNSLRMKDTVRAYLRNTYAPYSIVDSSISLLDSISFVADFNFLNAQSGTYYLVLKHRNGLETWSREGGISYLQGAPLSYDFTTDSSKAYGDNLVKKGSIWCIYSGDVNREGHIDIKDVGTISKAISSNLRGYIDTDLNGDLIVNQSDLMIAIKNSNSLVGCISPLQGRENE